MNCDKFLLNIDNDLLANKKSLDCLEQARFYQCEIKPSLHIIYE